MHVDGFRFDLATTLARDPYEFDAFSRFFAHGAAGSRSCRSVKLIAEPWDLGPGGYRLGGFPPGWAEWNGRYRDCVRRFWRGDEGQVPELASRLSGSSDIFHGGRSRAVREHQLRHLPRRLHAERPRELRAEAQPTPTARTTATARTTTSAATGASRARPQSLQVMRLRERMRRTCIATLAFSQGVPMISHGDEIGRTQKRQQQRLLPGQPDRLDRAGTSTTRRRSCSSSRETCFASRAEPGVPAAPLLRGRPGLRDGREGRLLGPPRRRRDDARGLGQSEEPHARHADPRRGDATTWTSAGDRTAVKHCSCSSTRAIGRVISCCRTCLNAANCQELVNTAQATHRTPARRHQHRASFPGSSLLRGELMSEASASRFRPSWAIREACRAPQRRPRRAASCSARTRRASAAKRGRGPRVPPRVCRLHADPAR